MSAMNVDVLILGGGVAGLAAAKYLRDHGVDNFILLEGSNRLGGRVHSFKTDDGLVIELGAGWVHGADSFPLYDLALESKVKLNHTRLELISGRDNQGRNVTNLVRSAYSELTRVCPAACEVAERMKMFEKEPDMSYKKTLEICGWRAKSTEEKCAEYLVCDFYYGLDDSKMSTRFSFDYDPSDPASADMRVVDPLGFNGLVQHICDIDLDSPNDSRILLNQVVTDVLYSDSGVTAVTEDGSNFTAKYAICTFSLGVLKSNSVTFTPPLTKQKQQCINDLVMTNYMKVFVAFDDDIEPFWDCSEMITYCSERKHYFTIWENLKSFGSNILVGTLTEKEADVASHWTKAELKSNVVNVLRTMYGDQIPEPKWIKPTTWATDPLFRGSFSGRPVGFSYEEMKEFKAPAGRLHFAGEALSANSYGDVYGAYSTGLEEGALVASALMDGDLKLRVKPSL